MAAEQMTMDFGQCARRRAGAAARISARQHHRPTTLTVSRRDFLRVANSQTAEPVEVDFVNDVVSSGSGGVRDIHFASRRIDLLSRQWKGGYRNMKIRCEKDGEVSCVMASAPVGFSDACYGTMKVVLSSNQENKKKER